MQEGNALHRAVRSVDTDAQVAQTAMDATSAALVRRIESVPFSRWHRRARIIVGSATFFDAFDALSIAFVMPVLIGLWHIEPLQIGILIGASYVGQFIGALIFGWFAERRGRIRSATISIAIMSVMSLGCALSGSFPMLLACRFIQGIGVGGEMPVAATYISELSNAHGRGKYTDASKLDREDACWELARPPWRTPRRRKLRADRRLHPTRAPDPGRAAASQSVRTHPARTRGGAVDA